MRWLISQDFIRVFEKSEKVFANIAVVGGGPNDPEINWLIHDQPETQIQYFGISEIEGQNFTYFDINLPAKDVNFKKFDLVHCAQVFEHLWDIKQALSNLSDLVSDDGLIWINCPASCRAHGSPDYFSAGYQPNLIVSPFDTFRKYQMVIFIMLLLSI
jgi:SAM-dependent methyltransferase